MPPERKSGSALKALRKTGAPAKPRMSRRDELEAEESELSTPRLDDRGMHVLDAMFEDIPQRSGMNSTRIAEVLNFRRNLPPLVTATHIHALSRTPTTTEREIAQLVRQGVIRKVSIPGRGLGSTGIGEFLVLTERWKDLVNGSPRLTQSVKDKYTEAICHSQASVSIRSSFFTHQEIIELVQAGFLTSTSSSNLSSTNSIGQAAGGGKASSVASAGSRAPAGSLGAVGGESAFHDAGGSGIATQPGSVDVQFSFSLPSVGLYLRLLAASREHLVSLLGKSSHREAPVDLLRERWSGGVPTNERKSHAQGHSRSVLPGRTRKWRQFYGVSFQWVLEECFGTGAIELFDTGAVGLGARIPI